MLKLQSHRVGTVTLHPSIARCKKSYTGVEVAQNFVSTVNYHRLSRCPPVWTRCNTAWLRRHHSANTVEAGVFTVEPGSNTVNPGVITAHHSVITVHADVAPACTVSYRNFAVSTSSCTVLIPCWKTTPGWRRLTTVLTQCQHGSAGVTTVPTRRRWCHSYGTNTVPTWYSPVQPGRGLHPGRTRRVGKVILICKHV